MNVALAGRWCACAPNLALGFTEAGKDRDTLGTYLIPVMIGRSFPYYVRSSPFGDSSRLLLIRSTV